MFDLHNSQNDFSFNIQKKNQSLDLLESNRTNDIIELQFHQLQRALKNLENIKDLAINNRLVIDFNDLLKYTCKCFLNLREEQSFNSFSPRFAEKV